MSTSTAAPTTSADPQNFVIKHPIAEELNALCSLYGISSSLVHVAYITNSKITMIKGPTEKSELDDAETIGNRFLRLGDFRKLASKYSIEMPTDVSQFVSGNTILTVWISNTVTLNVLDGIKNIDIFDDASLHLIQFVVLKLSFEKKPVTVESIVFEAFMLRRNGFPAICPTYAFIMRPPSAPFGWNAIASPIPSPSPTFMLAPPPSQSPMLKVTPVKEEGEEKDENDDPDEDEELVQDDGTFTDVVSKRRPKKGPEYFGVASAPFSAPPGSTYNRQKGDGIMPFNDYLKNGMDRKISIQNILLEYTKQVQRVHKTLSGKPTSDEEFQKFMKQRTGQLFDLWNTLHPWKSSLFNYTKYLSVIDLCFVNLCVEFYFYIIYYLLQTSFIEVLLKFTSFVFDIFCWLIELLFSIIEP